MKALLIGILASLIVTIIVEIIKMRRSRFHLSVRLKSSQSYASYTEGDIDIQVKYKSETIESSVAVLHLVLVNDGKKDMMFATHFSKGIVIRANGGNKIISASVEHCDVSPRISLNKDGSAILSWDIIKAGEKIDFELVISPESITLEKLDAIRCFNSLSFEIRSDCLEKIDPEREESPEERDLFRRWDHSRSLMLLLVMVSLMMFFLCMPLATQYNITVNEEVFEDATVWFSSPIGEYIVMPSNGRAEYFDPSDFEKASITVSIPDKKTRVMSSVIEIYSLFLFIVVIVLYVVARIFFRKRRRDIAARLKQ